MTRIDPQRVVEHPDRELDGAVLEAGRGDEVEEPRVVGRMGQPSQRVSQGVGAVAAVERRLRGPRERLGDLAVGRELEAGDVELEVERDVAQRLVHVRVEGRAVRVRHPAGEVHECFGDVVERRLPGFGHGAVPPARVIGRKPENSEGVSMPVAPGLRAQRREAARRNCSSRFPATACAPRAYLAEEGERAGGQRRRGESAGWLPPCGGEKGEAPNTAPEASPISSQRPSDPTGVTDRSPSPVPSSCAWLASLLSGRTRW